MISFLVSIAVLIIAYHTFGRIVDGVFAPDERDTPAVTKSDGVDFVPMKAWKAFLVELLNIAGTGPIFGALMGACFGPVVFIWIVIGGILAGAVHDYMIGMISMRNNGESIAELSGRYLGKPLMWVMRVFSVLLLILTGTVFVNSPAALIADLTPWANDTMVWVVVILAYYILATLLPIDKVIGKFYPIFGAVMLIMAFCITGAIIFGDYHLPELTLENLHPEGLPIWPYMFVTVACGAISGFHATQAPMISKCLMKESDGKHVFYGAMLKESVIALVWAAGGVAFYGATGGLNNALTTLGQSGTVYEMSMGMLGRFGGILAVMSDYIGRYCFPQRKADSLGGNRPGPETHEEPPSDYDSSSGYSNSSDPVGFCGSLEILLLEQPDSCHDCALDHHCIPAEGEQKSVGQPDQCRAGNIHDCRLSDIHPYCKGGTEARQGFFIHCRSSCCNCSVCYLSLPCRQKKETGEVIFRSLIA